MKWEINSGEENSPTVAVGDRTRDPHITSQELCHWAVVISSASRSHRSFLFQCTKLRQQLFGENHPKTQESLDFFATVYAEVGKQQYAGESRLNFSGCLVHKRQVTVCVWVQTALAAGSKIIRWRWLCMRVSWNFCHTQTLTHSRTHAHTHTHTHTHTQRNHWHRGEWKGEEINMYTHTHMHVRTHMHAHVHACTHTHTHTNHRRRGEQKRGENEHTEQWNVATLLASVNFVCAQTRWKHWTAQTQNLFRWLRTARALLPPHLLEMGRLSLYSGIAKTQVTVFSETFVWNI